nr:DUF3822 family protein [Allomuricauda sp.]
MTEKEIKEIGNKNNKLSIQIGLNGLSFCALDSISNDILAYEKIRFKSLSTPYLLLKEVKEALNKNNIKNTSFGEIVVIHKNPLFSLVPKTLFDENELPNYLKFNTKIMANDHIVFDELKNHDIINVYVPFTNVNNYFFDLFGEFEFKHSGTVLISTLLSQNKASSDTVCYGYVDEKEMEIVVVSEKKLLFYNYFEYSTPEDFLYYLLFVLEQLNLDTTKVQLKLFGNIEEGDSRYELAYRYVKNISVFVPPSSSYFLDGSETTSIDFTILNTL